MNSKKLALAAVAAAVLAVSAANTASATTFELDGLTQNKAVTMVATLQVGTSAALARTDGALANTCTGSTFGGATASPFTGSKVTGGLGSLTFASCSETITVDKNGQFYVEYISGTTNGTVFSENAEVTVKTPFGNEVNCRTGLGTDLGTLTGLKGGSALVDVNAVLGCGFLLPSATWKGAYTVTTPLGLGVSA